MWCTNVDDNNRPIKDLLWSVKIAVSYFLIVLVQDQANPAIV